MYSFYRVTFFQPENGWSVLPTQPRTVPPYILPYEIGAMILQQHQQQQQKTTTTTTTTTQNKQKVTLLNQWSDILFPTSKNTMLPKADFINCLIILIIFSLKCGTMIFLEKKKG